MVVTTFRNKFHPGQVVQHKLFDYRGVVVGVDETFHLLVPLVRELKGGIDVDDHAPIAEQAMLDHVPDREPGPRLLREAIAHRLSFSPTKPARQLFR